MLFGVHSLEVVPNSKQNKTNKNRQNPDIEINLKTRLRIIKRENLYN